MSYKTSIDWLSISTLSPPAEVVAATRSIFETAIFTPAGRGWNGYADRHDLSCPGANLGFLATGGASQKGRTYLALTGTACSMVAKQNRLADVFEQLDDARPTRIDVAFDDWHSQRLTIAGALHAHELGHFKNEKGGRNPKLNSHGEAKKRSTPWGGVTLTVGGREGDSYTRLYEKGCKSLEEMENAHLPLLQQQWQSIGNHWPQGHANRDELHRWLRLEVEMKAKTRALPFETIRHRDSAFAAVSSYHAAVVDGAEPCHRDKLDREIQQDAERKLDNIAKQYSKSLAELIEIFDGDSAYVWARIRGKTKSPSISDRLALVDGLKRAA